MQRGSGRLARASSTASGNVRTALWRCEAPKNRVSARPRRAHVVAASMTRASSERKCQVEKSNTRQKKTFLRRLGEFTCRRPLSGNYERASLAPGGLRCYEGLEYGFPTARARRSAPRAGLGGSNSRPPGFTFGAFDVLLNPRSTNENDEPNEQMCQVGPELVWRGSFYSRIKGLHARTVRNVVDFFYADEAKKYLAICEQQSIVSQKQTASVPLPPRKR